MAHITPIVNNSSKFLKWLYSFNRHQVIIMAQAYLNSTKNYTGEGDNIAESFLHKIFCEQINDGFKNVGKNRILSHIFLTIINLIEKLLAILPPPCTNVNLQIICLFRIAKFSRNHFWLELCKVIY